MVLRPKVGVQTVGRHGVSHEKGGSDELNLVDIQGFEEHSTEVKTAVQNNLQSSILLS